MSSSLAPKKYTPLQEKFLECLFNEAGGDLSLAMEMAGFKSSNVTYIIETLKDEIIDRAKGILALNSPKAVMALVGLMDNPAAAGAQIKLKAAEQVLDRVNIAKSSDAHISISAPGGIFMLPAKDADRAKVIEGDATVLLSP